LKSALVWSILGSNAHLQSHSRHLYGGEREPHNSKPYVQLNTEHYVRLITLRSQGPLPHAPHFRALIFHSFQAQRFVSGEPSAMEEERSVRSRLDTSLGFSESVMSSVAEAVSKIKNALKENQAKEQHTYISVTDAAFTERLEKAMLKNFDYLRR